MFTLTSEATFYRKINSADLDVKKTGWQYERVSWPDGNVWVHCFPDFENCGICPMTDPGQGAYNDPTDETACDYLMNLADADALQGNYTGSYNAIYHVLGEQNDRHYSVVMTYDVVTGKITMAFNRID